MGLKERIFTRRRYEYGIIELQHCWLCRWREKTMSEQHRRWVVAAEAKKLILHQRLQKGTQPCPDLGLNQWDLWPTRDLENCKNNTFVSLEVNVCVVIFYRSYRNLIYLIYLSNEEPDAVLLLKQRTKKS